MANVNLMSLNVRGLRNFEKQKAVFKWLKKRDFDIILLQETHTSSDLEEKWKREWDGQIYFSRGTSNS